MLGRQQDKKKEKFSTYEKESKSKDNYKLCRPIKSPTSPREQIRKLKYELLQSLEQMKKNR